MRVVVSLEHHFDRTPDGAIWTQTQFPYRFWERYLEVFAAVRVVARVRAAAAADPQWQRADGAGVSFAAIPHYLGPEQYLRQRRAITTAARAAVDSQDAVIMRVSSQLAGLIAPGLRRSGRPYGVEVVSDPYDVFAPGAVRHALRPLFRWWFTTQLRQQCMRAAAACYVTEQVLQRRYPCPAYAVGVSDVELSAEAIARAPRPAPLCAGPIRLINIGTLAQLYKAQDVLIEAVGMGVRAGLDLHLVLIGEGRYRPMLVARAAALGLAERVEFRGQLSAGAPVRAELDRADLFVLPSRTEGLPRALIEAMARGLPCIGSTVGGIPELLASEDLVPPSDAGALAQAISAFVGDPARMARASARNLRRACAFAEPLLRLRRLEFYQRVREQTEAWLAQQGARGRRQAQSSSQLD